MIVSSLERVESLRKSLRIDAPANALFTFFEVVVLRPDWMLIEVFLGQFAYPNQRENTGQVLRRNRHAAAFIHITGQTIETLRKCSSEDFGSLSEGVRDLVGILAAGFGEVGATSASAADDFGGFPDAVAGFATFGDDVFRAGGQQ